MMTFKTSYRCTMFFLVLTFFLSGCTKTTWVKQGYTGNDSTVAYAECQMEVLRSLPIQNLYVGRSSNEECKVKGSNKKCHSDSKYDTSDPQASLRKGLEEACMLRRGWSPIQAPTELGRMIGG